MDDWNSKISFKWCERSFADEWLDPTFPSLVRYMDPEALIFLYEKILQMRAGVGVLSIDYRT